MPYNPAPFPGQFSWRSAYWGAAVSAFAYNHALELSGAFRDYYGIVGISHVPKTDPLENHIVFVDFPGITYVGIEGTATWEQWGAYLTELGDVETIDTGMRATRMFAILGERAWGIIRNRLNSGRPFVLCGHSLGGATAVIASKRFAREGRLPVSVWTYGCPKPANAALANSFPVTTYRIFGDLDPVPNCPPPRYPFGCLVVPPHSWLQLDDPVHVGDPITVGPLDVTGALTESIDDIKRFGVTQDTNMRNAHFMGTYTEALFYRLTPDERGGMIRLFELLQAINAQGTPNFPLRIESPDGDRPTFADVYDDERESLEDFLADREKLRIGLFTNIEDMTRAASPADFREPAFPGYSRASLPERSLTIQPTQTGGVASESVPLSFRCSENLDNPVTVRGAFAVRESHQGTQIAGMSRFRHPFTFKNRLDGLHIRFSASANRVT